MVKYILQEMNDVRNTGKRAVYPKMVINQTLRTEEFIDVLHNRLGTVDKGVLGGEIVTVGSDAHQPEYIAWKFAKAAEILKDCGFRYYAEFESRRPQFHKIG